ncbi:hypothetical protein [Lentzea sp. NBRC 105346]|uniref:hypothetical protein n=1 Tax=Lentzea sp. NBRC 105346 TaxID=3032205 RepID=UPI0025556698|nr:hypothetical protein [Lentzea sp. NBRC 105346]
MHTSIAGLLHDHAVHEYKRQEFLRHVADIVGAAPMPAAEVTQLPVSSFRSYLNGVDQVLRDAARA